ncbi:zinc dependent phospholipase C family protein [Anaerobranca gottschalkii]|uniref:Zinc dependent phospholipase C n=1 Tax=Anaerobranca gottschalkii DSM 13577 TaxID=1120990 RepID=A0A1H9ZRI3_9FIRM|nr:zinc dependent phospholipase C family protein [Anaerobranca gottschalkii]SES83422.1 Zinc dependent phospholipase C [Anaerobranca gottschalkii DSM 13577]
MLVNTHVLIGNKVYNYLKRQGFFNLRKNSFIYGNIKPDLLLPLFSRGHNFKESFNFVLEEGEKLSSLEEIEKFSVSLGVINHFLADFFCAPHYSKEKFNLSNHMKYEFALHNTFRKLDKNKLLTAENLQINSLLGGNIKDTITALEKEYRKKSPSIENDIFFALRATTISSYYILNKSPFTLPSTLELADISHG